MGEVPMQFKPIKTNSWDPTKGNTIGTGGFPFEGGTQDKKVSKGHLPRVLYHQIYNVY